MHLVLVERLVEIKVSLPVFNLSRFFFTDIRGRDGPVRIVNNTEIRQKPETEFYIRFDTGYLNNRSGRIPDIR